MCLVIIVILLFGVICRKVLGVKLVFGRVVVRVCWVLFYWKLMVRLIIVVFLRKLWCELGRVLFRLILLFMVLGF